MLSLFLVGAFLLRLKSGGIFKMNISETLPLTLLYTPWCVYNTSIGRRKAQPFLSLQRPPESSPSSSIVVYTYIYSSRVPSAAD